MRKKWSQKSWLTLIVLLALVVFVLVNACAQLAARRFQTSLDLTEEQLYVLSADTVAAVEALPEDTAVYVFSAEADYPAMLREMLRRYALLSARLTVRYADPTENPVLMTHYQQMGATLEAGDLLVEGAKRIKAIAYADLILYDGDEPSGIDLEQQLTAALLYVNSAYTPRAVFTSGHGERSTTALEKLFTDNNFTVETSAVGVQELGQPEVMVLAAPAYDWTQAEIDILRTYVDGGGKLMVFLEPTDEAMPVLRGYLAELGMTVQDQVLFEPKAFAAGSPHNIIPMYATHAITAYFADHPIYVVLPSSGSIALAAAGRAEALLMTTPDAYAKTNLRYTSSQKEAGDATGQYVVAAIADSSVFLAASRMIYADDLMGMSTYANRAFLAQVLTALWSETASVSIPPKGLQSDPLPINGAQARTLGILLAGVLPLLTLAAGVFVKLRRRRL
ncbi:MAG: GldG family protein [Clostridiales bacterium]|nr:GldG family protein [Clostridiales bacterium]